MKFSTLRMKLIVSVIFLFPQNLLAQKTTDLCALRLTSNFAIRIKPDPDYSWVRNQVSNPLQMKIWDRLSDPQKTIDQFDPLLGERGLLIPQGGLCSITCGVNLMGAIRERFKTASPFPNQADEIDYAVWYLRSKFNVDARAGLAFDYLADVMTHLIWQSGLQFDVAVDSLTMNPETTQIDQLFPALSNSVPIIAIKGFRRSTLQFVMNHAMMVTAFNRDTGEITLLDPQVPWHPLHAQIYKTSRNSKHWSVRIDDPHFSLQNYYYINDVLNIRSLW